MAFRFAHTADVHLESPLAALALRDSLLAELIEGATLTAFFEPRG
jgi:DNA repair protein SbcD/Mre11